MSVRTPACHIKDEYLRSIYNERINDLLQIVGFLERKAAPLGWVKVVAVGPVFNTFGNFEFD
jgi:hypothetical protein